MKDLRAVMLAGVWKSVIARTISGSALMPSDDNMKPQNLTTRAARTNLSAVCDIVLPTSSENGVYTVDMCEQISVVIENIIHHTNTVRDAL